MQQHWMKHLYSRYLSALLSGRRSENLKGYLAALTIYLCSRLIILFAIRFSIHFVLPRYSGVDQWGAATRWYHHLLRWDSDWYLRIVTNGYQYDGNDLVHQTVIFFPLYPLIANLVSHVPGIDASQALLIVANSAALLTVPALFQLVREDFGDEVALTTIAFLSFFPASFFLSAGYSESLTLLLIVCCFLLLKRERYIAAAAFAGLSLAARPTGIVLLPVLLWALWRKFAANRSGLLFYAPLCTALATSGLWLYMAYLWAAFGYPLAFATNRAAWLNGRLIGSGFFDALLLEPFSHLEFRPEPVRMDPWFLVLFFLLIVALWRKLGLPLRLFGLGALLLPYLLLGGGPSRFLGMPRYALLAFPAFIAGASLCQGKPWLTMSLIGISAAMLFMYTAMFSQWYWVG
jgi:hypothetical protein